MELADRNFRWCCMFKDLEFSIGRRREVDFGDPGGVHKDSIDTFVGFLHLNLL